MIRGSTDTQRRTLLQRGIALVAGGAAVAGTSRWARAASPPAAAPRTLTLYARARPVPAADAQGRVVATGDLLDRPDGEPIGTFHTNSFCQPSPFGVQAAALEFHVLQLEAGTLFGIGSGGEAQAGRTLAIVGGTGAFAGRSGASRQHALAGEVGDDIHQLTITFAGPIAG